LEEYSGNFGANGSPAKFSAPRFPEESFERELQLTGRKKQSIAVLFLDLEHFKRFNDSFDRDAGESMFQHQFLSASKSQLEQ
jgi:diguanylate cyclase (GGDEF)-like protein